MRALVALVFLTGCAPGFIYTDITRPECRDMRGTKLGSLSAGGGAKQVNIPITRVDLSAEWDSKAIGDIAKANGISVVYSCDERTLSVLGGIWRKEEILVYGE
jgi:hypothetical protein